MTRSLLPPNSTPLERAIEAALARRVDVIPMPIRTLWNPDTCPAHLLGWLAWAQSVDVWDDDWSEALKREAIRAAFFVHRHKGTVGAVRRALAALNIGLEIAEWFDTGDAPGTFRIDAFADYIFAAGFGINPALYAMIAAHIVTIKPARAHYTLRVGETFRTRQPLRTGTRVKTVFSAEIDGDPRTFTEKNVLQIRHASRLRRMHRFNHNVQIREAA